MSLSFELIEFLNKALQKHHCEKIRVKDAVLSKLVPIYYECSSLNLLSSNIRLSELKVI